MSLTDPGLDPGVAACRWMRRNNITLLEEWLGSNRPTNLIHLGGIYPLSGNSYQDPGVLRGKTKCGQLLFH